MDAIDKTNPLWEVLYKIWLEQRKPGYVNLGETLYKVLRPSDENVIFHSCGSPEMLYESRSTKGLAK